MAYRFVKNMMAVLDQLVKNNVFYACDTGAPTNGASGTGAGFAATGSSYVDLNTGNLFTNIGTKAIPFWQLGANTAIAGVGGDLSLRLRFSLAQLNAGATILPAIPLWRYRAISMALIAIGGAAATSTSVRINGTQATVLVQLLDAPVAGLTRSTLLEAGFAGGTILADGASFAQCDINTPILLANNGAAMTGLTFIDVIMSYQIEQ